jgi:hypothetical protein
MGLSARDFFERAEKSAENIVSIKNSELIENR